MSFLVMAKSGSLVHSFVCVTVGPVSVSRTEFSSVSAGSLSASRLLYEICLSIDRPFRHLLERKSSRPLRSCMTISPVLFWEMFAMTLQVFNVPGLDSLPIAMREIRFRASQDFGLSSLRRPYTSRSTCAFCCIAHSHTLDLHIRTTYPILSHSRADDVSNTGASTL